MEIFIYSNLARVGSMFAPGRRWLIAAARKQYRSRIQVDSGAEGATLHAPVAAKADPR